MSIEGQGHFLTIYFPGFICFVLNRPRYQVSVYRTNGPLVYFSEEKVRCSYFSIKSMLMVFNSNDCNEHPQQIFMEK